MTPTDNTIQIPYKIVTLEEVTEAIDYKEPLMYDSETDGLYGELIVAQFYQENWDNALLVKDPDAGAIVKMLDKSDILVMQNGIYDITILNMVLNTKWIPKWIDTFYLARLCFYKKPTFALDDIMTYVLGYDPYADNKLDKKQLQKGTKENSWKKSKDLNEQQCIYAAIDVYYLPEVYNRVKKYIDHTIYRQDMVAARDCLEFQTVGMPVDERRRLALELRQEIEYTDYMEAILAEEHVPEDFNPNSWQQVRKVLSDITGREIDESDDKALAGFQYDEGIELAGNIRKYKSAKKLHSTLQKKIKSKNNRIYGRFSPSARSGRFTCSDQNLLQLDKRAKKVFGYTPEDKKVIVYSDFSQIQLRIAASMAPDTTMAKLYYDNADIHSYTQTNINWLQDLPRGRDIAKTCNFSLLFGGSANMLHSILLKDADILLPMDTVYRLKSNWLDLYEGVKDWQERGATDWNKGIAWSTAIGRKYVGKLMTDQLAIQIQGTEAEIAKLAFHRMLKRTAKFSGVEINNFIYDGFILSTPDNNDIYEEVCLIVADAMQSSWNEVREYFSLKDIPMPVDVSVGYNWGDIEDKKIDNLFNYKQ